MLAVKQLEIITYLFGNIYNDSTRILKSHKTSDLVNKILVFPNKTIEIFKIMPYSKYIFTL